MAAERDPVLAKLTEIIGAAEDVCESRTDMVALFVSAISVITTAAKPAVGDAMLATAIDLLTATRARLPEAHASMRTIVAAHTAVPS